MSPRVVQQEYEILEDQLYKGLITQKQYNDSIKELESDIREELEREAIKAYQRTMQEYEY